MTLLKIVSTHSGRSRRKRGWRNACVIPRSSCACANSSFSNPYMFICRMKDPKFRWRKNRGRICSQNFHTFSISTSRPSALHLTASAYSGEHTMTCVACRKFIRSGRTSPEAPGVVEGSGEETFIEVVGEDEAVAAAVVVVVAAGGDLVSSCEGSSSSSSSS